MFNSTRVIKTVIRSRSGPSRGGSLADRLCRSNGWRSGRVQKNDRPPVPHRQVNRVSLYSRELRGESVRHLIANVLRRLVQPFVGEVFPALGNHRRETQVLRENQISLRFNRHLGIVLSADAG